MFSARDFLVFFVFPVLNFIIWFKLGQKSIVLEASSADCGSVAVVQKQPESSVISSKKNKNFLKFVPPVITDVDSKEFSSYSEEFLVEMFFPKKSRTLLVNHHHDTECEGYINPSVAMQQECFAVAVADAQSSSLTLRYNAKAKKGPVILDGKNFPNGFFTKTGNPKGRRRLREKIGPLFENLEEIEKEILSLLKKKNVLPGSDVVVMVVNDGELDLFLNFACSCHAHQISLNNMIIFAGSSAIVPTIDVTGASGYYHDDFASVSKKASQQYLDSVFVDMMWFKAFSVWTMLKIGYNVVFQDVDLVWFKEPYSWFRDYGDKAAAAHHNGERPDAYFSDDGQRGSIRYSPFYANSGFYYLINNPRTLYFAYSVMTSFDIMQSTGSHQNVFTLRLSEGLDLALLHPKLLSLYDFPTGVVYHHDKPYMNKVIEGTSQAHHFHMCWTADKKQKLSFFRIAKMWYIDEDLTLEDIIPRGKIAELAKSILKRSKKQKMGDSTNPWEEFASKVCRVMEGAP